MSSEEILEIKIIPRPDNPIIGQNSNGGIINLNGHAVWLRHPRHRYNGSSWGWENDGFTNSDTSEVGYRLNPSSEIETLALTLNWLERMKKGELPDDFTTGIEIEGTLYDCHGNLLPKHDGISVRIEDDQHPELINFTVETATTPKNGYHLQSALEVASGLSQAVKRGNEIALLRNGIIVYSSVPESGDFSAGTVTAHPYLISFSPKVLEFTLDHWGYIPQEAKELYRLLGVDIYQYLQETGNLNWPVQALHIHTGIPQSEGLGDPRAAYACGLVRLTEFAKVVSLMLYNTRHVYGMDTGLKDVRSVMRRLLGTTIDSSLPANAKLLMEETMLAMECGEIHSPSRFPARGQHDRVRFRSEAKYKTVESIDAPMTPDLRLVLTWAYFNQIMNVIALDALVQTAGDESRVISQLKKQWGEIFSQIPATGPNSSYEQDLLFNKSGLDGKVTWIGQLTFRRLLFQIRDIIEYYAKKYPSIQTQGAIVMKMINQIVLPKNQGISLLEYLGIENGSYNPNGLNRGIITDYKQNLNMQELLEIQNKATQLQAETLDKIRDDYDLLLFFGD